jgi:hypothetical protein
MPDHLDGKIKWDIDPELVLRDLSYPFGFDNQFAVPIQDSRLNPRDGCASAGKIYWPDIARHIGCVERLEVNFPRRDDLINLMGSVVGRCIGSPVSLSFTGS